MIDRTLYRQQMNSREAFYRFLARFFEKEISDTSLKRFSIIRLAGLAASFDFLGANGEDGLAKAFQDACAAYDAYFDGTIETPDDLAVDYAKTFLGAGIAEATAAFPYESVYTSSKRIFMQQAWVKMHELLAKKGIEIAVPTTDLMEDHISIELEFMGFLNEEAAEAEDIAAAMKEQRDFIETHLINWIPSFRADVRKYSETRLYPVLADLIESFIQADFAFVRSLVKEADQAADEAKAAQTVAKAEVVSCDESFTVSREKFDRILEKLSETYDIYGPARVPSRGIEESETEIRYTKVGSRAAIVNDEMSNFSPKEVWYPISQPIFTFDENSVKPTYPEVKKDILIFARPCDINGSARLDRIYLENGGQADPYYQMRREHVKFILMECPHSFENCYCVSMGSNKSDNYSMAVRLGEDDGRGEILWKVADAAFLPYFEEAAKADYQPAFVSENEKKVVIPRVAEANDLQAVFDLPFWKEYNDNCIGCGGCNTVCPTCSCYETADFLDQQNSRSGERRRVWSSCMIPEFTRTAGGHLARPKPENTMRFKTLHKVYDYNRRFGGDEHMCVGCGRCTMRCPEEISFYETIHKLHDGVEDLIAAKNAAAETEA